MSDEEEAPEITAARCLGKRIESAGKAIESGFDSLAFAIVVGLTSTPTTQPQESRP